MPDNIEATPIVINYGGEEYIHNSRAVSKQQFQSMHERNEAEVKRLQKYVTAAQKERTKAEEELNRLKSLDPEEVALKDVSTIALIEELARRTKVDLHDDCGYCDYC